MISNFNERTFFFADACAAIVQPSTHCRFFQLNDKTVFAVYEHGWLYRAHWNFVVFVRDPGNGNYVGKSLGPSENGALGSCTQPPWPSGVVRCSKQVRILFLRLHQENMRIMTWHRIHKSIQTTVFQHETDSNGTVAVLPWLTAAVMFKLKHGFRLAHDRFAKNSAVVYSDNSTVILIK